MKTRVTEFFDLLQLICDRGAPVLHRFIVEVGLIWLLLIGLRHFL
jgi:hypothetical protein